MDTNAFSYLSAVEVFLLSPDEKEVLLLKRAEDRSVLPGYYGGVGGKMDSRDMETPPETAWREIWEETGYQKGDLSSLDYRGVYSVQDQFGRWQIHEFTGTVKKKEFDHTKKTEEGILEWVPVNQAETKNLIYDLRNGFLQKIINKRGGLLWVKVHYDESGVLKDQSITSINRSKSSVE